MYHIPLVKNIIFLKTNMQQEHAYITMVRFPDPNYGIKSCKLY